MSERDTDGMSDDDDVLLTVRQVAEMLQVSEETVRRACRMGRLASVPMLGAGKVRRRYRIKRSEVERFLDECANGA